MYYEIKTHLKVHKELVSEKRVKKALTIINPKWKARFYFPVKEDIPQFLYFWKEDGDYLLLPREFPIQDFSNIVLTQVDNTVEGDDVQFNSEITLKPEQVEAVETMIEKKKGILSFPCGSGKTVMALETVARLGKRTLILVHTNVLMKQWKERIKQFLNLDDSQVGIIGGGECTYKDKVITVAMVQSLLVSSLPEDVFDYFGVLVADEVHRHGSSEWHKVIHKFSNRIRFGLTATPKRSDGLEKVIFWAVGNIIYEGKNNALEPKVYLVKTDTYFPAERYVFWGTKRISLTRVINKLVKDTQRNHLIINNLIKAAEKGRKILLLSDRIKHLENLIDIFEKEKPKGISTSLFIGDMKEEQRREATEADVIFATQHIAKEGLDIPTLDTLFMVTPFSDPARLKQSVGRILRTVENKKEPIVVDFLDSKIAYLNRMGKKRGALYDSMTSK